MYSFTTSTPLVLRPHRTYPSKCSLRRTLSCAATSPSSQTSTAQIPETPCFTPRIMSTPMPPEYRSVYLHAVALATAAYLSALKPSSTSPVARITLLPPQLNPELDVYDRRFLLQLVWAVLDITASSCGLRTRVLVQGTGAFGAIPLSISGLKRMFEADLKVSKDDWPENAIRSGFLEEPNDLDDDDDIVIVVSPTNAISVPAIESLLEMIDRANGKPVLLLNPRLGDVPSHSGVMQVAGRKERVEFLDSVDDIFYMRLLFNAGTNYPLRGILHRSFPHDWQVWCTDDGDVTYRLISSSQTRPSSAEIGNAFSVDKYAQQKLLVKAATDDGSVMSIEQLLVSPASLALVTIGALVAVAKFLGGDILGLAHQLGVAF